MKLWLFAAEGEDGKVLAPALLRFGLREAFGREDLPKTERTAEGKPFFPDHPEIRFSYSHSGPLALCGLSDIPLGVDIEAIRPVRPGLARRVMSDREYGDHLRCPDQDGRLFALWTLKESFWKCTGTGIQAPYAGAEFSLMPDGAVRSNQPAYAFRSFAGDGWRAAICAETEEPLIAEIQWLHTF
jgi:4'-phosphopantetheinyl transferase